jgi:hypothetical protein
LVSVARVARTCTDDGLRKSRSFHYAAERGAKEQGFVLDEQDDDGPAGVLGTPTNGGLSMKRAISHENGHDIEITEDESATISDADLKWLEISLHRVFVEGQRLMAEREITEADRVRPVADETP